MLAEEEFLSDHGIRSLSRKYNVIPYEFDLEGEKLQVQYDPGESRTGMFGGNSNWRRAIWFPSNYLLIESLQKFDYFYGDDLSVEFPTGSGKRHSLWEVAQKLENRLASLFLRNADGRRPAMEGGDVPKGGDWDENVWFYEYFHGDNGRGLGASHQTGWTALIAKILKQIGDYPIGTGRHHSPDD